MSGFRQSFEKGSRMVNWFPKHMNSGLKQMQAKLRSVDCVLELHDSRIPLTGRNPNFSHTLIGDKPYILVFNKVDLIRREEMRKIQETYEAAGYKNIIFTNCKSDQDSGLKKLVPVMKSLIEKSERYHRTGTQEYHAMIIGIPNVGKSSLINQLRAKHLRKGRALKVGPSAGVTKCVHEKVKICMNPPIFLFDTPGILTPRINNNTTGMKLAVCGNLQDHSVGETVIADFILYKMNKMSNFKYVKYFGLNEPSDCIITVLTKGAIHLNLMSKVKAADSNEIYTKPNFDLLSKMFIDKFRTGEFGKFILDDLQNITEFKTAFQHFELLPNETFVSN